MFIRSVLFIATCLATPNAMAAADLRTAITANPTRTLVYATARYSVVVSNTGNRSASNSTVTIALPVTHTSPQVYVLGVLGSTSASCVRSGTKLTCTLGAIARGASKSVFFDIALPVSAAPLVVSATAATTSVEDSTANNAASAAAAQRFYATPVNATPGQPVTMNHNHCTGTSLTAWMECTFFASSITSHQAVFHADGTITFPDSTDYAGGWEVTSTQNGNHLAFYYEEVGVGTIAEFEGWGADAQCFEGLTSFDGSTYVAPYEVCPAL